MRRGGGRSQPVLIFGRQGRRRQWRGSVRDPSGECGLRKAAKIRLSPDSARDIIPRRAQDPQEGVHVRDKRFHPHGLERAGGGFPYKTSGGLVR